MQLSSDNRSVSTIIGAIFILFFAVIGLSLYQVQVVPAENSEVEFNHNQQLRNDMIGVQSAIIQASYPQDGSTVSVQLGTRYPARVFGINPPPASGTLATTSSRTVTVSGAGDICTGDDTTRELVYNPDYNEIDAPTTIYENSILYNQQDTGGDVGEASLTDAALYFEGSDNAGTINLVMLQNEFSTSRAGSISIQLVPGETKRSTSVTDPTVTLPTKAKKEDTWTAVTDDIPDASVANFVAGDEVEISFTGGDYDVLCTPVGVSSAPPSGAASLAPPDSTTSTPSGDPLADDKVAWNDVINNGKYDSKSETSYTESQAASLQDNTVDLIVAKDIRQSQVDMKPKNLAVQSGVTIRSSSNDLQVQVPGDIKADSAILESGNDKSIKLKYGQSGGGNANLDETLMCANSGIKIQGQGPISATDADFLSGLRGGKEGKVTFQPQKKNSLDGNLDIRDARIQGGGDLKYEGPSTATLTVNDNGGDKNDGGTYIVNKPGKGNSACQKEGGSGPFKSAALSNSNSASVNGKPERGNIK